MASRSLDRIVVISADCHAGPRRASDYAPYVDPEFRGRFEEWVEQEDHASHNMFGSPIPESTGDRDADFRAQQHLSLSSLGLPDEVVEGQIATLFHKESNIAGAWDSKLRLEALESDGIAGEVIHPDGVFGARAPFLSFGVAADPQLEAAGKRIYNRWLADLCGEAPDRRAGIIQISLHDVDEALREIERSRSEGLTGGVAFSGLRAGSGLPGYHDARYDPIWSCCEELDLTVTHHGGTPMADVGLYGGDPHVFAALSSVETNFISRRPFYFFVFGGVLDRHPKLRLVLTEAFASWVPQMLQELDSLVDQFWMTGVRQRLTMLPSEYWKEHCYAGASFLSRLEAEQRHEIGLDNLLWGADYPHVEGTYPYSREAFRASLAGLPEADIRKILGENAARVYGFDLAALETVAQGFGPTFQEISTPLSLEERPSGSDYVGAGFRR